MKNLKGFKTKIYGNNITTMWVRNLKQRILRMQNHASIRELVWTLIPTFILILVAIPSIELLYMMDVLVEDDPVFTYKIVGHQWYWSYDYFGIFFGNVITVNASEVTSFDSYISYLESGVNANDRPIIFGLKIYSEEYINKYVSQRCEEVGIALNSLSKWELDYLRSQKTIAAVDRILEEMLVHINRPLEFEEVVAVFIMIVSVAVAVQINLRPELLA